jgi:hypothetical protein
MIKEGLFFVIKTLLLRLSDIASGNSDNDMGGVTS